MATTDYSYNRGQGKSRQVASRLGDLVLFADRSLTLTLVEPSSLSRQTQRFTINLAPEEVNRLREMLTQPMTETRCLRASAPFTDEAEK